MYILADVTCGQLAPFMRIIHYLMGFIRFIIPIVLIALITIDFIKAIIANDNKRMNEAKSNCVRRLLYAVIIFLIPTIVSLLFKTIGGSINNDELSGATDWISCYNRFN